MPVQDIATVSKAKDLDAIGVPINPGEKTQPSNTSLFFQELTAIFMTADSVFGIGVAIFWAAIFIVQWTWFLMAKLFGMNVKPPRYSKKDN